MLDVSNSPLPHIAAALRAGTLTAHDLLAHASACHAARGTLLDAYKTWQPHSAQLQAAAANAVFALGRDLGPLQGIPLSVKDLYGVRGLPSYAGSQRRLPPVWEREGPLITALRRQLAVITGKTHTAEFALGGLGLNHHWGTPRNPWDADQPRVPGGSSSGAAVSLCEGSALLALGTDTGGSVRVPASMTGMVGMRTSFGRWSVEGIVPLSAMYDTAGLLARSVADLVYGFAALDPAWGEHARLAAHLGTLTPTELRLGVAADCVWEDCSPGVVEVIQTALTELSAAGVKLSGPVLAEAHAALAVLAEPSGLGAECDAFLATELPEWRTLVAPGVGRFLNENSGLSARELLLRQHRLRALAQPCPERFATLHAIVMPTVPITPPRLADLADEGVLQRAAGLVLRNTCVASLLGLCALTLPVGLDAEGLPVGLQLVAAAGDEERLLAVALCLEQYLGSSRQRLGVPPLCRSD